MSEAPPPGESLVFECDLADPPEKVWRAISEPDLRAAWLGEAQDRQVIEAAPGERLTLDWPEGGLETTVTFEIEPGEAGGTHLKIVHSVCAPAQAVVAFTPRSSGRRTMTAHAANTFKWAA
ncbi:MAG: SRPBCC domain-containing protein [Caulobacterales bacterium]